MSEEGRDTAALEQQEGDEGADRAEGANAARGMTASEGGHVPAIDPSPEARLMHEATVEPFDPDARLAPDARQGRELSTIDDEAAANAANDVRRNEHTAD